MRFSSYSLVLAALCLTLVPTADAQGDGRYTPRVMYWWGKVNQHLDLETGTWMTDPDGASGADLDMLDYCRRWYPGTTAVRPFSTETISTWREAGNVGAHTATMPSFECVQPGKSVR